MEISLNSQFAVTITIYPQYIEILISIEIVTTICIRFSLIKLYIEEKKYQRNSKTILVILVHYNSGFVFNTNTKRADKKE